MLLDVHMVRATVVRPHLEGTPTDWEYVVWVEEDDDADTPVLRAPLP